MFDPTTQRVRPPLPFACGSCIYNAIGRCRGPANYDTYTLRGSSLVTCDNIERRQRLLDDLYRGLTKIPTSSHQSDVTLPAFIPGVRDGMPDFPAFRSNSLFAVSLESLVKKTGTLRFRSIDELKSQLRLRQDARIALIGTAKDRKIERLWTMSDRSNVWERIAGFGFDFVTSLTFSVYDENPRADQIYNQDRNFLTHDMFANLGAPSIPFVYPYNDEDYADASSWLKARPDIYRLAVLAQFYKTNRQFEQFLENMRLIQDGVGHLLEFLVVGVARRDRIASILKEFNATIVSWKPFDCALNGGRRIQGEHLLEEKDESRTMSRPELAAHNVTQVTATCEELKRLSRPNIHPSVIASGGIFSAGGDQQMSLW